MSGSASTRSNASPPASGRANCDVDTAFLHCSPAPTMSTAPNLSGPWLERSCSSLARLEVQLQGALQNTRIARGADLIEVCIAHGKRRAADRVQVIKRVERFEAELTAEALRELQVLEHPQVRPPEARKTDCSRSFRRGGCLAGHRTRESRRIEPVFRAMRLIRIGIPHFVGAEQTGRGPQAVR